MLVTGHTGFKGVWISTWLSHLGADVAGLALAPDTSPSMYDALGMGARLDSEHGDIRDAEVVAEAVQRARPEIVFHLAAQSLVRRSYVDPVGTYATNVMGTAHVLDAVRGADEVAAVVVVTSDKCYDNREWVWPYRETDPLGGSDPYSSSKASTELVTAAWGASFLSERGVGVATARAGNVIGGGDWADDRLLPDCVRAFAAHQSVPIRNPGSVRPWQHVLEPISGYLLLAEQLVAAPSRFGGAWNFGPSVTEAWTVESIVDRLADLWGEGAGWQLDGDEQPHEAARLQVDISKAISQLGWSPRLSMDDALALTVGWYRDFAAGADMRQQTLDQIRRFEQWTETPG